MQRCVEDDQVNEDELFEDLMSLYTLHIRKSLMAVLLRVAGPNVRPDFFTSDDDSVTWKRSDYFGNEEYIVENEKIGKTTLYYYHKSLPTAKLRKSRDLVNASIFPTMSLDETSQIAEDIVEILDRVPVSDLKGVFQTALNVLETSWCSIQLVALKSPENRNEKIFVEGADIQGTEFIPESMRAPLARKIAEGAQKFGKSIFFCPTAEKKFSIYYPTIEKIANKVNAARDLIDWIFEECGANKVDDTRCKHPKRIYSSILTRPLSERMKKNADYIENIAREVAQNEDFMLQLLDSAVQDHDSFARGVELLRVPAVNNSVLYCGIDIVGEDKEDTPPPKKMRLEDERMRLEAQIFVNSSESDDEVPKDLLWPYYQDALLEKHDGKLTGNVKVTAEAVMNRDMDASKKYYTSFFW